MGKKQFSFTNENLYDNNIFGGVYGEFREAMSKNDLPKLYSAVEQYFYLTQHFYTKDSDDLERSLFNAHDLLLKPLGRTTQERMKYNKGQKEASKILRKLWKDISNKLEKNGFFKKSYTLDDNKLALTTGRN